MIVKDLLYCHLLTGESTRVFILDLLEDVEKETLFYRTPVSGYYQDPEIDKYSDREVAKFTFYPSSDSIWIWLFKK